MYRRARHVISENKRVQDSIDVLKKTDFVKFGELMKASHESLRWVVVILSFGGLGLYMYELDVEIDANFH